MSGKHKGDSASAASNKNKSGNDVGGEKKARKQKSGDIGRALRSIYDGTVREPVPDDFRDLLGKLN